MLVGYMTELMKVLTIKADGVVLVLGLNLY